MSDERKVIARFENIPVQACSHPHCRVACDGKTHYIVCENCKLEAEMPCDHSVVELQHRIATLTAELDALHAEIVRLTAERDRAIDQTVRLFAEIGELTKERDALRADLDATSEGAQEQYNAARSLIRCPDQKMSLIEAIRWLQSQLPTGNMMDLLTERDTLKADLRACAEALESANVELRHARVFIHSREIMHPDGRSLYDETCMRIDKVLSSPGVQALLQPRGGEADGEEKAR